MTSETLKSLQTRQNNGLIISMYTMNIPMDLSIWIMRFIIIKNILNNINTQN
jgi:hypothetical protein